MKYFLSIALLLAVGCKNDGESEGDLKTLDQLAGSKNVYTCQSDDPTNYPSAALIQSIVIGDTKCDAKVMSSDCKEVAKAIATVPKVFQDAFVELGGSIKIGGDTDQICGVTLQKAEVVGASKVSGIDSCWAIGASDRAQPDAPSKVVVIAHKDVSAAKQNTTRVFGYFVSQALPYVNPDGTSYKYDFSNIANKNIAQLLTERKIAVANQFVREINMSKEYSLTSMSNVLGEALDYVKVNGVEIPDTDAMNPVVKNRILAFSDFVSADAFDSMYCGSSGAKLAKANAVFTKTIADYNKNVHPVLEALAKAIADNKSGHSLTTTTTFASAELMVLLGATISALQSMPKASVAPASTNDIQVAGKSCGGACAAGCTNCQNGNCNCGPGGCSCGGGCGPGCTCPGCTANAFV